MFPVTGQITWNGQASFDMSTPGTSASDALSVLNMLSGSVHLFVSGASSPSGTFTLQASNDGNAWADLPYSLTVSGNDSLFVEFTNITFRYLRCSYVRTSGGGTATIAYCMKGSS